MKCHGCHSHIAYFKYLCLWLFAGAQHQKIIIIIIIIIIIFLKCHKVLTSEALATVELVGKGQVEQKSLEPRFRNCQIEAFENYLMLSAHVQQK